MLGAAKKEKVEKRSVVDLGGIESVCEAPVGDLELEVLGHLVLVDDGAGASADVCRAGAVQPPARVGGAGGDLVELAFGRGQQIGAFARAFGGDGRVAAHDQALPGELGRADLGQRVLVKQ